MSWNIIMDVIIKSALDNFPDIEDRQEFYKPVIETFDEHGCDGLQGCVGVDQAFDDALRETFPDLFDDDNEDEDENDEEESD